MKKINMKLKNTCRKQPIIHSIVWAAAIIASALLANNTFLSVILLPVLATCHILYIQKHKPTSSTNCH